MNKVLRNFLFVLFLTVVPVNAKKCLLCDNGNGLTEKHFELYSGITNETNKILETPHFYVSIDNYLIGASHLLIVPKKHALSFSSLNISVEHELDAIIKTLCTYSNTNKYTLWEHGSNGLDAQRNAASITHAHLHFVPNLAITHDEILKLYTDQDVSEEFCTKRNDESFLRHLKSLKTNKPYRVYYSSSSNSSLCIPDDTDFIQSGTQKYTNVSCIIRKVFGKILQQTNKPFWNRKDPDAIIKGTKQRNKMTLETLEIFKYRADIDKTFKLYNNILLLKRVAPRSARPRATPQKERRRRFIIYL